jgi:two-component system, cell cycle sensor histidine kinase and response regulator CckA
VNVGDLMQKTLTATNEELKGAQERELNLRKQLLHSQKMEAVGTLAAGVAHDFNNLLTVVNGFAEILLMDTPADDPRREDLERILETGRKGAEMVKRLRMFSQKAEMSPKPEDLNQLVANTVNLTTRIFPRMIRIETILAEDLARINADAVQLEQVLMNLCINAKDAMPEGGRLRIETRNITVDDAYCRFHARARPGQYVLLEVSDTGVGMDKETMDRIFDPFFTTKGWDFNKGTGLGLSVANGIVEQHGGWITCHSEQGMGTKFRVYLEALEGLPEHAEPTAEPELVRGVKRILLVDDEELVRVLGKRIFRACGLCCDDGNKRRGGFGELRQRAVEYRAGSP